MSKNNRLSELASWLQGKARTLSYNDENAALKHRLHEASHALDAECVRVSKKGMRLVMRSARGKQRHMSLREHIAYLLLGKSTEMRP